MYLRRFTRCIEKQKRNIKTKKTWLIHVTALRLEHVSALIRVQQQDVNVDPDVNVVTGVNVQAAKSSVTAADLVAVVKDALDRKTANAQTIPDVAAKSNVTAADLVVVVKGALDRKAANAQTIPDVAVRNECV
uniref:Uncharacterized protein n=1 Tax=Magallana gigas TaxID=29159 RepID=A0A8W8LXR5_MAGGI